MQKIEISKMTSNDLDEVLKIENANFSEPWSKNSFLEALNSDYSHMIVAKSCGIVLGYVGMYSVQNEGYVYNIAVDQNSRGSGVGTCLMENLIEKARKLNLAFLSLEVRESNIPAINLYSKLNFVNQGIRKNFYSKPNENAIIMTVFL